MAGTIVAEETLLVGQEITVVGDSPSTHYSVVFEDDGDTGYFYACDREVEGFIVDAMHIYNVHNVSDKHLPSDVVIAWSEDGLKAALFINRYPHAVFDFSIKRGYCRTNFPPPGGEWAKAHSTHEWDDAAVDLLR